MRLGLHDPHHLYQPLVAIFQIVTFSFQMQCLDLSKRLADFQLHHHRLIPLFVMNEYGNLMIEPRIAVILVAATCLRDCLSPIHVVRPPISRHYWAFHRDIQKFMEGLNTDGQIGYFIAFFPWVGTFHK